MATEQEQRDEEFKAGREARKESWKMEMGHSHDWMEGWSREDNRQRNPKRSPKKQREHDVRNALQSGATYADFIDGATN